MQFFQQISKLSVKQLVLATVTVLLVSTVAAQQKPFSLQSSLTTLDDVKAILASPSGAAVLASSPSGVFVSVSDVLAELRRAMPSDRQALLAKPDMVQQLASNLLVRRVLAAEAKRDSVDNEALMAATLALAKDRLLSDARLERAEVQNMPTEAALEAYARDLYQTNLSKFEKPAQTRVRQILLAKCGADTSKKAQDILSQLRSGASFEELAKTHSVDTASAARGGDLGLMVAGKMPKSFDAAVAQLVKPGDLSEPVESESGIHIIRLEERLDKSMQPFAEVREQLMAEVRKAIVTESRGQTSQRISKDFTFDQQALDALAKIATP